MLDSAVQNKFTDLSIRGASSEVLDSVFNKLLF